MSPARVLLSCSLKKRIRGLAPFGAPWEQQGVKGQAVGLSPPREGGNPGSLMFSTGKSYLVNLSFISPPRPASPLKLGGWKAGKRRACTSTLQLLEEMGTREGTKVSSIGN